MGCAVRGWSTLGRAVVAGLTVLLWAGVAPGEAAAGSAAEPGNAMAWGSNGGGQLGTGTNLTYGTTPGAVCGSAPCPKPLGDVVAVEGGQSFSVALRSDGTVWAWGENTSGQLGDGTFTSRSAPVRVASLADVTAIAAGSNHTLALRSDGTVWSWGYNPDGELGNGTTTSSGVPVQVCAENTGAGCTGFLTGVTAIAAGHTHSLALDAGGGVRAWGGNVHGQLGDGTTQRRLVPVPTVLTSGVRSLGAGLFWSLAAMTDGTVRAWGDNFYGYLGDGTTTERTTPVRVCAVGTTAGCTTYLTGVASVAGGEDHSLAVLSDGGVRAWGHNDSGQLGDGTTTDKHTPVRVCASGTSAGCTTFLGGATAADVGFRFSVTRQADGTARAWGANGGRLGDGTQTNRSTPVRVCAPGQTAPCSRLLDGVGAVAAGYFHSLAIVRPRADLRVTITSDAPVANNEDLTYTITVRNDGPTAADNVVLDNSLPGEGRFVSATPSRGSCGMVPPVASSDTVTCALGSIGVNAQATVTIRITVKATTGTMISNTAAVASGTPDPNQANNSVTLTTAVS
ncbi:hypothetical protein [Streptomyces sp. NBC_00038]|uniref:hypothetical protein n=1 Tax=Streptomyces sp. NBC_00038 TaxID=2903615 RepID=UPI00224CF6DC|nr:hypothetical protein [Streptomyces sp. NBC_00038]MCX5560446.1 hypothetical protein [Streptomyces sp. NBC_00038]